MTAKEILAQMEAIRDAVYTLGQEQAKEDLESGAEIFKLYKKVRSCSERMDDTFKDLGLIK